jgi:hypothetical protein
MKSKQFTKRQPTEAQKQSAQERRLKLVEISNAIKIARESGVMPFALFSTVNEGLVYLYKKETGAETFNTFNEWRALGYKVKKGEKSFAVWSSPKEMTKETKEESGEVTTDEYKAFATCNLFHEGQVEKREGFEIIEEESE